MRFGLKVNPGTWPEAAGRARVAEDVDPRAVRRILLAYGSITPWSTPDAFPSTVERYRELGIDEIVC